jgi:cobalt-zinc-cadmium efflux system outer membrane protein
MMLAPATVGCRSMQPPRTGSAHPGSEIVRIDDASGATDVAASNSSRRAQSPNNADRVARATYDAPPQLADAPEVVEPPSTRSLALADFEAIAFESNPTLSHAAARVDAAIGRQVQAGLYPNPRAGYHAMNMGNQGTSGEQGAFISQQFVLWGKLRLDTAMAGAAVDEAHFLLESQEQRVLTDVRTRFYEALVAQRRVELSTELARIGDELVEAAETLLENRQGTENDVLQAQIRADESHILLDNATNELLEAWQRLAAVAGAPSMPAASLTGALDSDVPELNWETYRAMVLEGHPELEAARARAERADIAIDRARREPLPNVDVSLSLRHDNSDAEDLANLEIGIPIPVFDRNQGNVRAAEAEWIAANNEVERIELDLRDQLAMAYRRYANARQQVERYRDRIVPRAKESLELVTGGYEEGQVEYLTLLVAQQTYIQVNLSYLDSLRELRTSAAMLEGQLLTGSLTEGR